MIVRKMYRYLGRNGIITSPIFLEKAESIPMKELIAEYGKILTNGTKKVYSVVVFEDEVNDWKEIDNN